MENNNNQSEANENISSENERSGRNHGRTRSSSTRGQHDESIDDRISSPPLRPPIVTRAASPQQQTADEEEREAKLLAIDNRIVVPPRPPNETTINQGALGNDDGNEQVSMPPPLGLPKVESSSIKQGEYLLPAVAAQEEFKDDERLSQNRYPGAEYVRYDGQQGQASSRDEGAVAWFDNNSINTVTGSQERSTAGDAFVQNEAVLVPDGDDIVVALPLSPDQGDAGVYQEMMNRQRKRMFSIVGILLLVVTVLVAVVVGGISTVRGGGGSGSGGGGRLCGDSPSGTQTSTLEVVCNRDFLRCGVVPASQDGFNAKDPISGEHQGFEVDLCKAIAAAIFGTSSEKVQFIDAPSVGRLQMLQNDEIDVLARLTTHTMERDVFEPSSQTGFTFSTPYLYNGLGFGGDPFFISCADQLDVTSGDCAKLKICVLDSTTHAQVLSDLFPSTSLIQVPFFSSMLSAFANGLCNVISGEQFGIAESVVRGATGYSGDYVVAPNTFSKEPIAMVTRQGDPRWSDFVNWVLVGLMRAEERNVVQATATNFGSVTPAFGQNYLGMFVRAIAEVGNYGEIYARHLESIVPRERVNTINPGDTGLIYSLPYGDLQVNGDGPTPGGTIEMIRNRGFLRCGIRSQLGFGVFDTENQTWSGFDVDYCRAVSAALFDGVDSTVEYVQLSASERFSALAGGDIDLLCRTTTATFDRDVLEPSSGEGFTFSQTTFYDGLAFGGIPPFGECADTLGTSGSCSDLKICVQEGTTTIARVKELFPERFIVPVMSNQEIFQGLNSGQCNTIAGDSTNVLQPSVISLGQYTGPYQVGTKRFSKEPLTPLTRQDDDQWSDFVYWIVSSTFYAEEEDITQATADRMPRSGLFGPQFSRSLANAIQAVGNYGEIYNRNLQGLLPRGGANDLNLSPFGPQIYVRPGISD